MSTNMYDALDNDNGTKSAEARRTASVASMWGAESETFLADVAHEYRNTGSDLVVANMLVAYPAAK